MKKSIYTFLLLSAFLLSNMTAQNQCDLTPIESNVKIKQEPTPPPVSSPGTLPPPSPPPPDDERIVGYVHGIGGGSNTWVTARNWTEDTYERAITPSDLKYNMDKLRDASYRIQEEMDRANNAHIFNTDGEYDEENSFIVAHSLGGLVSRDMEYRTQFETGTEWEQQQFGGLITFGTPHYGTELVNNLELAIDVANEGCHRLAHTKVTQFVEENFSNFGIFSGMLKNFLYAATLESIDNVDGQGVSVSGIVCDNILDAGISYAIAGMLPPIAGSMAPDSEELDKLNNHEFTYPLIACYGVEDDPVSIRQIVATQHNIDEFEFGGADLIEEEKEKIEDYEAYLLGLAGEYDYYSNLDSPGSNVVSNILIGAGIGAGVGFITSIVLSAIGAALGIGTLTAVGKAVITFLGSVAGALFGWATSSNSTPDYDLVAMAFWRYFLWTARFDTNYRIIMGIDDVYTTMVGEISYPNCEITDFDLDIDCALPETQEEFLLCEEANCADVTVPLYEVSIIRNASDGTVRASSASEAPHAGSFKSFDMPGSNHVQLKNDSNTDRILRQVFAGGNNFSFYFRLSS